MTASAPVVSPELAELASAMDGRADTYGLLARLFASRSTAPCSPSCAA